VGITAVTTSAVLPHTQSLATIYYLLINKVNIVIYKVTSTLKKNSLNESTPINLVMH